MTSPVTLYIPLQDIYIDGDKERAVVTFPDGEVVLRGIVAAMINPDKAAVIPAPHVQEGGEEDGQF